MIGNYLQNNWALIAGGLLGVLVAVHLLTRALQQSAIGKLSRSRAQLRVAVRQQKKAAVKLRDHQNRLQKLAARSETTKPRILQETKDSFDDAKTLHKIASDKVLIAENHVRKVIHEEYAPTTHERMMKKHLPAEKPDQRPFSF